MKTSPAKLASARAYKARKASDPKWVDEQRLYMKRYRQKKRDAIAERDAARQRSQSVEIRLKRKKVDVAHAEAIRSHAGSCDLCGRPPDGKWKSLNIDHCHKSLRFRGMLCTNCNRGLGHFCDDPELLRKAAEYIERSRT